MNTTFLSIKRIVKWMVIIFFVLLWVYPFVTSHSVLTPIAVSMNSPSLCQKISSFSIGGPTAGEYTRGCYISIAIARHDVSVCNNVAAIVDEAGRILGYRDECYASVAVSFQDASVCDNPNNLDKDSCYVDYSRRTEDIVVCKNIKNVKRQTFCYEYFRTKSGDACFEIKDDAERLQCIKQNACATHQC